MLSKLATVHNKDDDINQQINNIIYNSNKKLI